MDEMLIRSKLRLRGHDLHYINVVMSRLPLLVCLCVFVCVYACMHLLTGRQHQVPVIRLFGVGKVLSLSVLVLVI